jgi:hypothetical protein
MLKKPIACRGNVGMWQLLKDVADKLAEICI